MDNDLVVVGDGADEGERHGQQGEQEPAVQLSRVGRAEAIIQRNVLWSLGAGLVPFPVVDVVAVTAVQVKMLKELSDLYEVSFSEDIVQKSIGALVSGLSSVSIGGYLAGSFAKLIPGLGTAIGIVAQPVIAGAFTLATGRVFLMHFEAGGTILDFDPYKMRAYFKREFEKAKETVARQAEEAAKVANKA